MDLDLSHLTDDQLVELARLCCQEAVRRGDHTGAAMHAMMIDEAERARIARTAAENEAAAIRARERARIAEEAAARVRAEDAARNAAARQQAAKEAAERAAAKAASNVAAERKWLSVFADLVGRKPAEISIVLADTRYGRRLMVNKGFNRYSSDHLVDHNLGTGSTKTTRELIRRKPEIAGQAAAIGALHPKGELFISGDNHDWEV
jgi:hypothetical protein